MNARINLYGDEFIARQVKHLSTAGRIPEDVISLTTQNLCLLRASQINGCGVCTDMHTKDALHVGETPLRLAMVAAWREATVFTDAERAALELTEEGTRIADAAGGVSDEVWARAAEHYDESQLAALILLVAIINAFNRLNLINQQPAGDYQPGQWG